jgi:uncharacterized protein (DUF2236 family)
MSEADATRSIDNALFAQNIAYVKSRAAGHVEGIYGPQSQLWSTMREMALLGGGIRALLLQIAHPAVAAGVHQHSNFQKDPVGRGYRTFSSMYQIAFGDLDSALKSAMRIHSMHHRVRGVDDKQSAYRANDPKLLLWVLATLIDSALQIFEVVVRPLERSERQVGYEEVKLMGLLMGIPQEILPSTRDEFDVYFQRMIDGPELGVNDTTRLLCDAISRSTFGLDRVLTVGLLPERFRRDFGLEHDRAEHERALRWMRALVLRTPPALRFVPAWHQAMSRVGKLRQEKIDFSTRVINRVVRMVPVPLAIR